MQNTSLEQVLGFSKKEAGLYRVLNDEPLFVAEIAEKARLPRMTTHYALQRFLQRGLVRRVKRDKRFFYYRVSDTDLVRQLIPTGNTSVQEISVPITNDTQIAIHRGWEGIYKMYERITRENVYRRIYTIQTTESTKHIFENYSVEKLDEIHKLMKENEVILEDIVEEDFFLPIYKKYKTDFKKAIGSFLDRLTATYVLPCNYIKFKSDMVVGREVVVFIDWNKQIAVEVRAKEVVHMCYELFQTFKSQARHVQFQELATPYLA
jgi:predicted transcriptional regulator